MADQLESIPLQTEAVEPGHAAGTRHADWSSASRCIPPLHVDACRDSDWQQHLSVCLQQECHRGGWPRGKPGCAHSPGSFDSGLRGLPDPGMNRDSSALATEIFISFYSLNNYSMNIFQEPDMCKVLWASGRHQNKYGPCAHGPQSLGG